jgi:hypothetical protein
MGLLSGVLLLPLAPLRGTIWIAERLAEYADEQLDDDRAIRRLLFEAEGALESGDLSEPEFDRIEDELLDRLDAMQTHEVGVGS